MEGEAPGETAEEAPGETAEEAPISIERGAEIEKDLREEYGDRIHMDVHTLVEDYWAWVYAVTKDDKFACETPGSRTVSYHALCNALDKLGPTLSSLKQEQEDFELQKQVFQSHVSGFSSAMEEVLKIITRIDQMVQDQKGRLMDQLLLDQEGVAKVIEENITHEMKQWGEVLRTLVEKGIPDGKTPFRLNYKDTKRLCGFRNRNNFKLWPHSFWERT